MTHNELTEALVSSRGTARHWDLLRGLYREMTPLIFEHRGLVCPYRVDWGRLFTPIESLAWGEVRNCRVRMFPQYPAGRYFLDFADPRNQIALECDGKQWHDEDRDRRRDAELFEMGWCVYRVTGAECVRIVQPPWEYQEYHGEDPPDECLRRWYMQTVEGVCESIEAVHYGGAQVTDWHYRSLAAHTYQDRAPARMDVLGFVRDSDYRAEEEL